MAVKVAINGFGRIGRLAIYQKVPPETKFSGGISIVSG